MFTFNVTLTKQGLNKVTVDGTEQTITSGTAFQVDVSYNSPVTITDIPLGTVCAVEEDAASQTDVQSVSYTYSDGNSTPHTINAPMTVTVKNTYEDIQKTITLYKQDAETHSGIPGGQFYLLKLRNTTDINNETVKSAFADGTLADLTEATASYPNIYADIVTSTGTVPGSDTDILTTDDGTSADAGTITATLPSNIAGAGERYFFYEKTTVNGSGTTIISGSTPQSYVADNSITAEKVITINNAQNEYIVTYTNERVPTSKDIDAQKKDKKTGDSLGGAIFDLYYKEVDIPKTYTVNDPLNAPTPIETTQVGNGPNVPGEDTNISTTPDTYTYNYTEQSVPSASDKDWILPRTDNDYIYFRDYNTGTPGMADKQSFDNSTSSTQHAAAQQGNRSWLLTNFNDNVHGQHQELDYTHNYWYAAQFTGSGKQMVQYAVWERFVDRYTDSSNRTSDTVVWKIQPPDGYTKVRFCLYDGDQCIRTTDEITFQLGAIYHKTNWGGKWKSEGGNDCYFNVPTEKEDIWSTYKNSAAASTNQKDQRQTSNVEIYQADRYTPTEQKIVFHCNSKVVWHNIHIEFFTDGTSSDANAVLQDGNYYKPVGQSFPGYMMEPYAYAGSDYRINGYLTYELTIPAEAKYFRVNNGVTVGSGYTHDDYGYYSKITALKYIEGRKNYGNYFKIKSGYREMTTQPIQM